MRVPLLLLSVLQFVHGSCPAGWELAANGQCRGYVSTANVHWDEDALNTQVDKCVSISAHPVYIHNDEQQSYWKNKSTTSNWLLIGLGCYSNSKQWQWADGSTVNYRPQTYDPALDKNCKSGCAWRLGGGNGHWLLGCDKKGYYEADIFCTTSLEQPKPSSDGCESFEDDSPDGVCYQIGATAENWQDAQKICHSFGAEVASIHNSQENSFVRRVAVSKGAVSGVYLGANITSNGNKWIDNSKWDYSNFLPGFPINGLGECLVLDSSGTSGEWSNVACSSKFPVACQRKQHYTTPACSAGPWNAGDIIYSPGFPVSSSTPCDYILSVDDGKKVQVEILLLEANSCCDHLILYENYVGGTIIANLTGEINDKTYKTTSSNFMRVSWQPNGGKNVRGLITNREKFDHPAAVESSCPYVAERKVQSTSIARAVGDLLKSADWKTKFEQAARSKQNQVAMKRKNDEWATGLSRSNANYITALKAREIGVLGAKQRFSNDSPTSNSFSHIRDTDPFPCAFEGFWEGTMPNREREMNNTINQLLDTNDELECKITAKQNEVETIELLKKENVESSATLERTVTLNDELEAANYQLNEEKDELVKEQNTMDATIFTLREQNSALTEETESMKDRKLQIASGNSANEETKKLQKQLEKMMKANEKLRKSLAADSKQAKMLADNGIIMQEIRGQ